jgi:hypothetical protein
VCTRRIYDTDNLQAIVGADMSADEEDDVAAVSLMGNVLPVRMLNDYANCPRLFHLMHVEGRWAGNHFTEERREVHNEKKR